MTYRVMIDLSHNESIEFPEFSLEEEDLEIDYIDKNEGPIDFSKLEDYDILFLGNIKPIEGQKKFKFSPEELTCIKKFVGEGGGLFLTTSAGGDHDIPMKDGSIRVLYKVTGVKRFWNGIINEISNNFIVNKQNLRLTEFFNHPITRGLKEVVLPECTFFSLAEEVDDLILTSEKATFQYYSDKELTEVGSVPVCAVSEFFEGRAVTVGSSEFLKEDSDFGVDAGDNFNFLTNIINWLCFEL